MTDAELDMLQDLAGKVLPEAMIGVYRELRECREKLRVYEQQESLFRKNGKI